MQISGRAQVVDRAISSEAVVPLGRAERVSSQEADRGSDCTMEHRLGTRVTTFLPVRVIHARALLAFGRMLDASLSGAYIETSAPLPLFARIDVVCGQGFSDRAECSGVAAYVTRAGAHGVGVEWLEFAPPAIRRLMLGEFERFQKGQRTAGGVKSSTFPAGGADPRVARATVAIL